VDGPVAAEQVPADQQKISSYLCTLAQYYGALEAGITDLRSYHVYSHIGRGQGEWGAEIPIVHRYAIAFTVEMDQRMVAAAPYPPSIMESGRQYVEASRIAIQLAAAIRALGYPARAHIDGNYQVIAPLVARDAGLGEIGRMGLLMTPDQGPRVRLGVVTTNLTLVPGPTRDYSYMIDACSLCKKCATCCPSGSIPAGERKEIDGALRWRINADTCFRYWCSIGTDCGRCLAVCPFSHPRHWTHSLIRQGIEHSGLFRRAALHLDDWMYGRKPPIKQPPSWTRIS
jgi:ferredoxin